MKLKIVNGFLLFNKQWGRWHRLLCPRTTTTMYCNLNNKQYQSIQTVDVLVTTIGIVFGFKTYQRLTLDHFCRQRIPCIEYSICYKILPYGGVEFTHHQFEIMTFSSAVCI